MLFCESHEGFAAYFQSCGYMCDMFTRSGNITLQFDVAVIVKLNSCSSNHEQVLQQNHRNNVEQCSSNDEVFAACFRH